MEKFKKPKVVFTYVEAGFGHMMPARAVSDAFKKKYGDKCEVVDWNIFSDSKNQIVKDYSQQLFGWTKNVSNNKFLFLGEIFSYIIGSKNSLKFLDKKFKKAKEIIMHDIEKINPDLMFNTYYSPSHFALECKKNNTIDTIVATYTPDPVVYPAWDRRSDLYFVNNDQAKHLAIKTGFKKESVYQVPFVLRGNIKTISDDKAENRKNLGLDENKFTIVLASGAYGTKKDIVVIENLLKQNLDVNIVVICGKNEELFKQCEKLKENMKNSKTNFYIIGFTDRMFEYNSASNLFIGKGGANAMVESYYFAVPTIVSSCANPLEQSITKYYIDKKKCGEKIFSPNKLVKRVVEIVNDQSILNQYKENLLQFHDASGAEKIADILYQKLKEKMEKKSWEF